MYKKFSSFLYTLSLSIYRLLLGLKEESISVENYTISYLKKRKNYRQTLIALHGLNDTKETWLPFIKNFDPNYQTILIDLLGCGKSSKPYEFDYSLTSQAQFLQKVIAAIMEKENINSFSLIGHSMGGGLAMLIANSFKLDALVLVAPLSINYHSSYLIEQTKSLEDITQASFFNICSKERFRALIDTLFYIKPKIPDILIENIIAKKCADAKLEEKKILALINEEKREIADDLTSIAKSINQRTLIIWGEKDRVLNVANAYELQKLMKHSQLRIFKECGHMVEVEYPKKFANSVENFL